MQRKKVLTVLYYLLWVTSSLGVSDSPYWPPENFAPLCCRTKGRAAKIETVGLETKKLTPVDAPVDSS